MRVGRLLVALLLAAFVLAARAPVVFAQVPAFYPAATQGENYMRNYLFPQAASSTPWAPSWAPDGKSVAVGMGGSIWRVDMATGVAAELTSGSWYHSSPDWSPDGRWLVYTADDGRRNIRLEMLEVATGHTHLLTGADSDSTLHFDPVFSPDGTRLAYVSTKPNGRFNVYVRPIKDGRWNGEEVAITTDHPFGRNRLYFGAWDMHITPTWFPDGRELLLVANRGVALGSGDVWRVPAVAGGMEHATPMLSEQTLYRTRPHVSPDGTRFVYASTGGSADEFNNLYMQSAAAGHPYKLTFFTHDAFHPRWSPDGEQIAFISNEGGLPQLEVLEVDGGARRRVRISRRNWRRPMGAVRVRTVDAATGRLTAARVHLTASDGKFYAPPNAFARISGEGDHLYQAAGSATIDVPPGPLRVVAVKGFEFTPESTSTVVGAGKTVTLTLTLRRIANLGARGWHNGSTHVHANYGGTLHNTFDNLLMMSAAEGQDVLVPLVANKDNRILDQRFFVPGGGAHPRSRPDHLILVGEEYRPPVFGHLLMLGLRDHLVSPFTNGYAGTALASLAPSNTEMLRKARAQGAFTAYVHAFRGEADPRTFQLGQGKAFLVDAALGTTDAIEWSYASHSAFIPWYAALNAGLHVTAVGGEDAISNMHQTKVLGAMRTYVHTGRAGLSASAVLAAMRRGRAFVTNGPLVQLTVGGREPGDTVYLPASGGTATVDVDVRSITPLTRVWLVQDGEALREIPLTLDRRRARFSGPIKLSRSGWLHLRAEGSASERSPLDASYAQAFTNPVWVSVGERAIRSAAAAEYGLSWIDSLEAIVGPDPGWRSAQERRGVLGHLEEARAVFRRLAREASSASR